MVVTVKISETYDLSTKQGKMTLIGVHTPRKNIIQKLYPGFCMQYKMCRIVSQDVQIACASMLPADPLQVGVTAGSIAPEDLFNPILYKAVSNDSMSQLEARLQALGYFGTSGSDLSFKGESAFGSNENVTPIDDEFGVYYALLSNRKGFRIAHPQEGLSMCRLRPLVYEKWYNVGVNAADENALPGDQELVLQSDTYSVDLRGSTPIMQATRSMRGRPHPMPAFNTTYLTYADTKPSEKGGNWVANGMGDGQPGNAQCEMPDIQQCMTQLICIPPSKLHTLYYRMVVTTTVSFFGVRPITEITQFSGLDGYVAPLVHYQDYQFPTKMLPNDENTVQTNADIKKIMESGN